MKRKLVLTTKFFVALMILLSMSWQSFSQSQINVIMKNVANPNPNKVTFEIWLENASSGANAGDVLSLQSLQFSFGFNNAALGGGTVTPSLELGNALWPVVGQQNPTISSTNVFNVAANGTGQNFFRLAAATASAPATVIPTVGAGGIRYATFAFTNTLPFATGVPFNFLFNTTLSTNGRVKTQVNAYLNSLTLGAAWNDPAATTSSAGYPTSRLLVASAPAYQIAASNNCATTATAGNITNPVCPNGTGSASITLGNPAPTATSGTYTINGGASQNWTSNPFTVSGLPIGTNTISVSAAGCTTPATGTIVITGSTTPLTSTDNQTACNSYTWGLNGQTYTTSGTYTSTTTNGSGCTVTNTLNLVINTGTTSSSSATACNSYTWSCNGNTYTASGAYTCTSVNTSNGCINTTTLNLTINSNTTSSSSATACNSYLWSCNGNMYNISGAYTCTSVNASGCINTETLNLTINNNTTSSSSATACNSYTWACDGNTYTASGAYSCTSLNTSGCTNTETLNLTISNSTTSSSSVSACNSYTWSCNGNTYTASGAYTCTTANSGTGCTNIETLNLTINNSTTSSSNATACDTYTWSCNGTVYTASGTYTCTSLNASGCLNTATLNLTMNNNTTSSSSATACNSYTWSCNGNTYSTSGSYSCTSLNASGCVNTATLNLTINNSTSASSSVTATNTYTWSCNGATYTTSGAYTCTSTNAAGCVHTQTLNLTINFVSASVVNVIMKNVQNPNPNKVTFEIWLENASTGLNAADLLSLQSFQFSFGFNAAIAAGGTITPALELGNPAWSVVGQQNPTISTTNIFNVASLGTGLNFFRLAAATASAPSTLIPTTANGGIRYATFSFTNSVPFATGTPFNFLFNTTLSTNGRVKTQVNAYLGALTLGAAWNDPGNTTSTAGYPVPRLLVASAPAYQIAASCATTATPSNIVNPLCPNGTGSASITIGNPAPSATSGTYTINGGATQTWSGNPFTVSGLPIGTNTISVLVAGCTTPITGTITITGSTVPLTTTSSATACGSYTWAQNIQTYTVSGTYTSTSLNSNGCSVLNTLNLVINNGTTSTMSATACDSYTWSCNGNTYTTSGVYTCTSINPTNGCTNSLIMNLVINSSTTSSSNATACDTYTWSCNGTTYTASGTYTCTSMNSAGCLHTETLSLIINNSTSSQTSATACDSYTWACNGMTYTTSGVYTCSSMNTATGCANVVTLDLSINNSTSNQSSATACDTYTWSCNGTTYTASGTYTCTSMNAAGCLHTETLSLTINTSSSNQSSATACDTYTWSCNGTTYTASGTYTCTSMNSAGCLHTETLSLIINNSTTSTTSISACNTYTWPVSGLTYTVAGTYTQTSLNTAGCVHTSTLVLTLTGSSNTSTSVTACNTYTWSVSGLTYTASGTYTKTSLVNGCTNTAVLILTIGQNTTSSLTASACNSYTWSCNGNVYTASGMYTCTSLNTAGCVNTTTLNLTIKLSTSSTTNITACNSYTWSTSGLAYTASGTYTKTSLNAAGCVHTATLNLTINNTTSSSQTVTSCNSYSWSVTGLSYTASGTYTKTSLNAAGCVHTSILLLTIGQNTAATTVASACNSYTWSCNGNTYTSSGSYTCTSINSQGCFHTQTLTLTIKLNTASTTNITACNTYTWSASGLAYTTSGTYIKTSMNTAGCVNTATLNLTINNSSTSSQTVTACNSYTWSVSGLSYTTSGIKTKTSVNASGCVHTSTLVLTINHTTAATTVASACNSYTWSCNGNTYTASGSYTCTSINSQGCLHTQTLTLTIKQNTSSSVSATACNSYTWSTSGLAYTASGTYTKTSLNTAGCVHTTTLNLTINNSTSSTQAVTACNTYTWSASGLTYTVSGTYTKTSLNSAGCLNTATLNLTINNTTTNTSSATACDTYTWGVNGNTYTTSGTYTATSLNAAGCVQSETLNLVIQSTAVTTINISSCGSYTWSCDGNTYTASGTYTCTSMTTSGCLQTTIMVLTINSAPVITGLNITGITGTSATANWNPVSGTGWYSLRYRVAGSSSAYTFITIVSPASSKLISGLTPGVTYEVGIQTFCGGAAGAWSPSVNFTTNNGCSTPVGLVVSLITPQTATFSWTAVVGATSYQIRYRVIGSPTWITTTSTVANKAVSGLISSSNYEVQVAVVCGSISSAFGSSVNFTTLAPCGTPSGLSVTNITNTTSKLNWLASTSATYYSVRYRAVGSLTWITGTSTPTNKSITGLTPGTQYEFQVAGSCGTLGSYSASFLWTTSTTVPPTAGNKVVDTEESIVSDVNIYPNPTSDVLNIDLTANQAQTTTVKVLDMSGRLIKQVQLKTEKGMNPMSISLGELASGIYALQIFEDAKLSHVSKIEKK